jgi:hypothetical protein
MTLLKLNSSSKITNKSFFEIIVSGQKEVRATSCKDATKYYLRQF